MAQKTLFLHRNSILTPCYFLCQFWHCVFQFVTILTTWPVNQVTCWRGMMMCQFWWRGMLTWYADVSKLNFFLTKNTKFSFFSILTLSLIFSFNFDTMFFCSKSNIIFSNFVQCWQFFIWNRINIFLIHLNRINMFFFFHLKTIFLYKYIFLHSNHIFMYKYVLTI